MKATLRIVKKVVSDPDSTSPQLIMAKQWLVDDVFQPKSRKLAASLASMV